MLTVQLNSSKESISINGNVYQFHFNEVKSFVQHCSEFMDIEGNGLETMSAIIADQIIDGNNEHITTEELRTQLKFMRELSFLMKNMITQAEGK